VHAPLDRETWRAMILRGEEPTPNRHQCSGKHSGMLANCQLHGYSLENYIDPNHPLQELVLAVNAEMWDIPAASVGIGIDGCSVPVFAVPLRNAAYGYARLMDPADIPEKRSLACRRITAAMTGFPEMVAGNGWFDTELMRAGAGSLITKMGAEGFQSVAIRPGKTDLSSRGVGVAIKIMDGDLRGSIASLVAMETLRQLGALTKEEEGVLSQFGSRPLRNWRGLEIGQIEPVFKLNFYG
jgi:L-asparaginase II